MANTQKTDNLPAISPELAELRASLPAEPTGMQVATGISFSQLNPNAGALCLETHKPQRVGWVTGEVHGVYEDAGGEYGPYLRCLGAFHTMAYPTMRQQPATELYVPKSLERWITSAYNKQGFAEIGWEVWAVRDLDKKTGLPRRLGWKYGVFINEKAADMSPAKMRMVELGFLPAPKRQPLMIEAPPHDPETGEILDAAE